jgi:hypothetical protein
MKVDRRSLVNVRFRAAADIYESVEFVLRNGSVELARRPCCYGRPQTCEHEVALEVRPKCCGAARIELDVVCRVGAADDVEVHTAALKIDVDAGGASSFCPTFNINQNLSSDRAGDTKGGNINVNLGGLKLNPEEDASRYETPGTFSVLRTTQKTSPRRLTLKGEDGVVQLLSDDVVSFGRKEEDNTVPLRIFGPDGKMDPKANANNISRRHFRIERSENGCLVRDGGVARDATEPAVVVPSAYGTRVDGERLRPAGCAGVASGRDVSLCVGREDVELKMNLRFFRDGWNRPAGILLDRGDGARQRICVVWRKVPLSAGEAVSWNGTRWTLEGAAIPQQPLAVGTSVSIDGRKYEILPFHKTHVN